MADSTIGSLPAASEITAQDLFVLEQNGEAKKLLGSILTDFLDRNIVNVTVTSVLPTANPTVSYDAETGALQLGIPRGLGIAGIAKTGSSGLTDTYTVTLDQAPGQAVPTTYQIYVTNGRSITGLTPISAQHNPGTLDQYAIDFNDGTSQTLFVYNGSNGTNGTSIVSITKASGTGAGGTTDVYNVNLSNGTVGGTFSVYNGEDGEGAPGSATPLMDGAAAVGTANAYSREDHVHPVDTSRQAANLYFSNAFANSWASHSDTMFSDYDYRCAVALTGVTNQMYADVIFAPEEAVSGNYAPACQTYNGGVYIYSKVDDTITVPTIIVFR